MSIGQMARTMVSALWCLKFVHSLEGRKGKVPKQWNSNLQTGSGAERGREAADSCCRQTGFTPSISTPSSHPILDAAAALEVTATPMLEVFNPTRLDILHLECFWGSQPSWRLSAHPSLMFWAISQSDRKAEMAEEEDVGGQEEN